MTMEGLPNFNNSKFLCVLLALFLVIGTWTLVYLQREGATDIRKFILRNDLFDLNYGSLADQYGIENVVSTDSFENGLFQTRNHFLLLTTHGSPDDTQSNNVNIFLKEIHPEQSWKDIGFVLDKTSVQDLELQNLRGIVPVNDVMFIASAHTSSSKIVVARKCGPRPRKAELFTTDGLDHPYGVAFYDGSLYATNQNDDSVTQYSVTEGKLPKARKFADVKHPRGLTFDLQGRLWVSSTKKGVIIFNLQGQELFQIDIEHPVGIACNRRTGIVYVGSATDDEDSAVYSIDPKTLEVIHVYRPSSPHKLLHPAGIAINQDSDILYVVEQMERKLYSFDLRTDKFLGVVADELPDRPEQLALLTCESSPWETLSLHGKEMKRAITNLRSSAFSQVEA